MRPDRRLPWLALAALPGLILAPTAGTGSPLAIALCSGGPAESLADSRSPKPAGDTPACHAACLSRRGKEDGEGLCGG